MREKLLDAAEQMVQDRGLNAVSFQQLADAVGLSKPTVFHHFHSKEDLAQALVDRCRGKYGDLYGRVVDSDLTAPEKLRQIAGIFESGLKEGHLCLLGALGNSIATLPKPVQENLHSAAAGAINRFSDVFEQGKNDGSLRFAGTAEDAAMSFLAMLQGLQVLARAEGDHAAFGRAAAAYVSTLAT